MFSNTKRPGRPRKTTVVDDRRILSLVKKTPFTTVGQIKNTLQEVGVCVSKSTIKRRLHQSEYRGFTTRCKPLVRLKNRKARLEFAKRHLKKPSQFWNNILWTDETKINLYQSDGKRRVWRRKGTAHDLTYLCCIVNGAQKLILHVLHIKDFLPSKGFIFQRVQNSIHLLPKLFQINQNLLDLRKTQLDFLQVVRVGNLTWNDL